MVPLDLGLGFISGHPFTKAGAKESVSYCSENAFLFITDDT